MANLTPKKRRAVLALVEHGDASNAATAAGVTRQTLYRWLNEDADFIQALREAEYGALQTFQRELVSMGHLAAAALRDGLQDEDIRVRLRAADIFTQRLLQLRDLLDFEDRLQKLEAVHNEK